MLWSSCFWNIAIRVRYVDDFEKPANTRKWTRLKILLSRHPRRMRNRGNTRSCIIIVTVHETLQVFTNRCDGVWSRNDETWNCDGKIIRLTSKCEMTVSYLMLFLTPFFFSYFKFFFFFTQMDCRFWFWNASRLSYEVILL